MAVTESGLFVATFTGVLNNTIALDLTAEDHRIALFDNTITPDFKATASNARYGAGAFATGEVVGTGYTAGGELLLGTTLATLTLPEISWTASDVEWANSTITARCALIYADAIATPNANPAICLIDFEDDYPTNNGTFTISFDANGICSWLLVASV